MILLMIRHGKTPANERHLYCGRTDISLSEKGRAELMEKVSARYDTGIGNMRVLTSGMKRCEETLEILFGKVQHEKDPAFREMDFGDFEMRSYEEMKEDPAYIAWISGDNETNVAPSGESGEIMKTRVLEGLGRLISEGKDTLLVTHGGVIALIMAELFPEEGRNRYEWQPKPGGGYSVDITGRTYSAIS